MVTFVIAFEDEFLAASLFVSSSCPKRLLRQDSNHSPASALNALPAGRLSKTSIPSHSISTGQAASWHDGSTYTTACLGFYWLRVLFGQAPWQRLSFNLCVILSGHQHHFYEIPPLVFVWTITDHESILWGTQHFSHDVRLLLLACASLHSPTRVLSACTLTPSVAVL